MALSFLQMLTFWGSFCCWEGKKGKEILGESGGGGGGWYIQILFIPEPGDSHCLGVSHCLLGPSGLRRLHGSFSQVGNLSPPPSTEQLCSVSSSFAKEF